CRQVAGFSPGGAPARELAACCDLLSLHVEELHRDLHALLPWAAVLYRQPAPFGDGQPLENPEGRPHVFGEVIFPPGGRPRGLVSLAELMDRSLAEVDRLDAGLDPAAAETPRARAW